MKSILLFTFISILGNFMWCSKSNQYPKIEYGPLGRKWNVKNITEVEYDSVFNFLMQNSENYKPGEKVLIFEERTKVYKEYENGYLIKTGTYLEQKHLGTLVVITSQDSVFYNPIQVLKYQLRIQSEKPYKSGKIIKTITAERKL